MRTSIVGMTVLLAACGQHERTSGVLELVGDPMGGRGVYETNCAECHGVDGEGVTGPDLTSHLSHHGDANVVDIVLGGSGNMPSFEATLSDQDVADVLSMLRAEFDVE